MKSNTIRKRYISSLEGLPYLLNLEMVAGLTGLNYETIKRLCQNGKIKAIKIGREWRISQDDLLNTDSGRIIDDKNNKNYNDKNEEKGD